ncbi:MAG: AAA family ATPase [Dehalococcoidia bacterium]
MENKSIKIAITGKGGSGKTMLTALMTKLLAQRGNFRVLAIDADSSINLPYTLGMKVNKTVSQIRWQVITDPQAKAAFEAKPIKEILAEAMQAGEGFKLLVMGRPEGPGCYCAVNELMKFGIDSIAQQFDITLIDCEAGPEQVNRRVVKKVDLLIIVTDTSIRGSQVAGSIMEVVQRDAEIRPGRTCLVINRFKGDDKLIQENAAKWGLEVLGRIPEDNNVTQYDSIGKPIIDLPDDSPSVMAVREILQKIDLRGPAASAL